MRGSDSPLVVDESGTAQEARLLASDLPQTRLPRPLLYAATLHATHDAGVLGQSSFAAH